MPDNPGLLQQILSLILCQPDQLMTNLTAVLLPGVNRAFYLVLVLDLTFVLP